MTLGKDGFQKVWKNLFNQSLDEKSLSGIEKILNDSVESEKKLSDIFSSDIEPMHKISFQHSDGRENANDN